MAKGEFIWFLGDDDLLIPSAIHQLSNLIKKNEKCDFFYINSFYLDNSHIEKYPQPFHTKNLPKKMTPHSKVKKNKKILFFDLIDPKIPFDFLCGIYVCAFRRKKWNNNLKIIDKKLIKDKRVWSNFENTCFFIKVFCEAFNKSKTFVCATPLSVSLSGVREWVSLYEFVEIVRIPEALDYYRSKGLNFFQYIKCKNYALRNFFNFFFKIILNGKEAGLNYVNFKRHFLMNLIYPNAWFSIIYYCTRNLKKTFNFKSKA